MNVSRSKSRLAAVLIVQGEAAVSRATRASRKLIFGTVGTHFARLTAPLSRLCAQTERRNNRSKAALHTALTASAS